MQMASLFISSGKLISMSILLDPSRIPAHIAIIMDGNGRWARAQGQDRLYGHWQGYRTLKQIVYAADDIGVRYLTVYGFSSENWSRPSDEVSGLMDLMIQAIKAEMDEMAERGVQFRVSGRPHELPQELQNAFAEAVHSTRGNPRITLNLAVNYGGRAEIVDAVRQLIEDVQHGVLNAGNLQESDITSHLYNPDIPDPDLLIRTAGEKRISNFLLWESAYAELWITETPWPAFTRDHLEEAIADYQSRVRKFGAVVE
jgi:undecaprenyl diphosphate synthase